MKKVGQTLQCPFGINWWSLKNPKNQNFEKMKKRNYWRYHHFTHVYQKPESYEIRFLRYEEWKNENFRKIKKNPGDTIILHNCTKNNDHRLYCSWDMARDRCNCYFSFWAICFPVTLPSPPGDGGDGRVTGKQIAQNEKSSFYTGVPKIMIRWCTVSEIWYRQTKKVTYRGRCPI